MKRAATALVALVGMVIPLTGLLCGEPLAAGDVILAVDGDPIASDPIGTFRAKIGAAREKEAKVVVTRWRAGTISNVTVNLKPSPTRRRWSA